MNPFKYGRVVSKNDYCTRQDLETALKTKLLAAQNTYLEGERRTGKTSLIFETVRKMKTKKIVYADLLEVRSVEDIHKRVLNAVVKAEKDFGVLQKMLKNFAALRPIMTYDPMTGSPTISVDSSITMLPDSLEGLFDLFTGSEFKNAVVVIDEFQDILNLPDARQSLAIMRSKIQFLDEIPFVFCGSLRSKIHMIFNDPESPFFKSALPIEVGPIDHGRFSEFIGLKFRETKIKISAATIERLLHISHENPGDTQQLCAAIYDVAEAGSEVTESTLHESLMQVFAEEQKGYESTLARITGIQLKCLVALARQGGNNVLSGEFTTVSGIRLPSTIKKSLERLENLKIIFKTVREYKFVNPFFAQWLIYKNF